jgi:class 3 adenylate cyclase
LCAHAEPWQILTTERVVTEAGDLVVTELVGELELPGFSRTFKTVNVRGLDAARPIP